MALSTLGFGLPLGFTIAAAWAGTSAGLLRTTRLGLLLASSSVGVAILGSSAFYLFSSLFAAVLDVPLALAIPSVIAGVLMLLLVGPGQVAAVVAEGRSLVGRAASAASAASAVVTTAGAVGGSRAPAARTDPHAAEVAGKVRVERDELCTVTSTPSWVIGDSATSPMVTLGRDAATTATRL